MKNKRPPSNTESLIRLKDQNFFVRIEHFRFVPIDSSKSSLMSDRDWRTPIKFINNYGGAITIFRSPDQLGGETRLTLERGEEKFVVQAVCSNKERFSRRQGVKIALEKLKKLHGIE